MSIKNDRSSYNKKILSIILKNREKNQYYIEPFVGRCDTIHLVDGNRIGNDINPYLINMWESIQSGWIPPKFLNDSDYNYIDTNRYKSSKQLIGYIDLYVTKYVKLNKSKTTFSKVENSSRKGYFDVEHKKSGVLGIQFTNNNYLDLIIPDNSIILCNIPGIQGFDLDIFWDWCRNKTIEGHIVYVVNNIAPDDFTVIWKSNGVALNDIKLYTYNKK